MKILLVHNDKYKWATTIRAEALKIQWINDEVEIVHSSELPNGDKYDIIHFLYSGGITKSRNYILKNKKKVFTTLASYRTLDCAFDKLKHLVQIYKETVFCVCHNKKLESRLKQLIQQDNVIYIPNGVDEKLFDRKFVVGYIGAKKVIGDHKGIELAQHVCSELGLELRFAHDIPHTIINEFYKTIDCLILPSLSEGCNNPTLEALAMNKPVISTDVGIADELEGVIIVERNIDSIKKALRKLSGRIQILENYTWKIIANKYHKLYEGRNNSLLQFE